MELSPFVKPLSEGNPRIAGVEIVSETGKMCIICAYMPTHHGPESLVEYLACLGLIGIIISKYRPTHTVVLCGDMNASLVRHKPQDIVLQKFVNEHDLTVPGDMGDITTYCHQNGLWKSQIDYILVTKGDIPVRNCHVVVKDPINTSCHDPVQGQFDLSIDRVPKVEKPKYKSRKIRAWDKADPSVAQSQLLYYLPATLLSKPSIPQLRWTQPLTPLFLP
jgi:hypothetical protein